MERIYNNEPYLPLNLTGDNQELANKGERVLLRHERYGAGLFTSKLIIALKGIVSSGWVIGIIEEEINPSHEWNNKE